MKKYDNAVKLAQIKELADEKKYRKAAAILRTIDPRQVHLFNDLKMCAVVYMKTEQYDAAKATYLRLYKKENSKQILQQLIYISIRMSEFDEADRYYAEFVRISRSKRDNLILHYRIEKAKAIDTNKLISILEELNQQEYLEEWAYELAKLYQKTGQYDKCRNECENIKTWFGRGEIVERATLLLTYLTVDENLPVYQDKDYTIKEEKPNLDDTGSMPIIDPSYFEKQRELQKRKKRRMFDDTGDFLSADAEEAIYEEEHENAAVTADMKFIDAQDSSEPENQDDFSETESEDTSGYYPNDEKEESYDEDLDDEEDVIMNEPENVDDSREDTDNQDEKEDDMSMFDTASLSFPLEQQEKFIRSSQSGTGITQNLAKEITAIFEAEKEEQLKEREVIDAGSSMAGELLQRMNDAAKTKIAGGNTTEIPAGNNKFSDDDKDIMIEAPEGMQEIHPHDTMIEEEILDENSNSPIEHDNVLTAETNEIPYNGIEKENVKSDNNNDKKEVDNDMINLDEIMPEPDMPETKQVTPRKNIFMGRQDVDVNIVATTNAHMTEKFSTPDPMAEGTDAQLTESDLPTTRALHKSIQDMLVLIRGEKELTHYVLMGNDDKCVLGITKKIVRIMNQKNFISSTQIAMIDAQKLNETDILAAKNQLKGTCLLITNASKLLFTSISGIFSLMDEFSNDFVVVLSDEGETLDKLFQVTPALARRFQYILDISKYGPEEYM